MQTGGRGGVCKKKKKRHWLILSITAGAWSVRNSRLPEEQQGMAPELPAFTRNREVRPPRGQRNAVGREQYRALWGPKNQKTNGKKKPERGKAGTVLETVRRGPRGGPLSWGRTGIRHQHSQRLPRRENEPGPAGPATAAPPSPPTGRRRAAARPAASA